MNHSDAFAGDDATQERELREAHRLYTEMGATGHAERLARELAELEEDQFAGRTDEDDSS